MGQPHSLNAPLVDCSDAPLPVFDDSIRLCQYQEHLGIALYGLGRAAILSLHAFTTQRSDDALSLVGPRVNAQPLVGAV